MHTRQEVLPVTRADVDGDMSAPFPGQASRPVHGPRNRHERREYEIICPELLLPGTELQRKTSVEPLEKKGKRFESNWIHCYVGIYARILFYYDNLESQPRSVIPLMGASVSAVDRIIKNQDDADAEPITENCGPCWKVTTSAGRVLLFRSTSLDNRRSWMHTIQRASIDPIETKSRERAASSDCHPETRKARSESENSGLDHVSAMLKDAMNLSQRQRIEINQLREQLQAKENEMKDAVEAAVAEAEARSVAGTNTTATGTSDDEMEPKEEVKEEVQEPKEEVQEIKEEVQEIKEEIQEKKEDVRRKKVRKRSSFDIMDNDYLQQQAMELAEIARNLKFTYKDAPSSPLSDDQSSNEDSISSLHADSITRVDRMYDIMSEDSLSDSYDDIFDVSNKIIRKNSKPSKENDTSERLSEFGESDRAFLQANGVTDIHDTDPDFVVNLRPKRRSPNVISSEMVEDAAKQQRKRASSKRRDARTKVQANSRLGNRKTTSEIEGRSDRRRKQGSSKVLQTEESSTDDLAALLTGEDMTVVASLLQTANREEKANLLFPLLRIFASRERLSALMTWAIDVEVSSIKDVATLFRSDDYASRLVSTYSKAVGSTYIKEVLGDPIRDLFSLKVDELELNPAKCEAVKDERGKQRNADRLMAACQKILDCILEHQSEIPSSYNHICAHLTQEILRRFDGSVEGIPAEDPAVLTRSVVGGFLFLRFVCPAITTPHMYNLTEEPPGGETRKVLVLVTKLLFKTATCVHFSERETHFQILNPFIERNAVAIDSLFASLTKQPEEDVDTKYTLESRNIFSNLPMSQLLQDLDAVRIVGEKNLESIEKQLMSLDYTHDAMGEVRAAMVKRVVRSEGKQPLSRMLSSMRFLPFGKKSRKGPVG